MTIEIIEEKVIKMTQAEYERLMRQYENSQRYTTAPVSFETWLRSTGKIK